MNKEKSPEFLAEIWNQAKKTLPGWLYASLLQSARPRSGGLAAHRIDEPDILAKLALPEIKPIKLKEISDEDLGAVWLRLNQWYANAKKRKQAVENFVNAGLWTKAEIERRGKVVDKESAFVQEIEQLEGLKKERTKDVKGERKQLPAFIESRLDQMPEEILLVRDFVNIAGSAAVAEKPNDIDVVIRAEYDTGKQGYLIDGKALGIALRRFLSPEKEGPQVQLLGSPQGSFTDYIPMFDLVARRRESEVQKIEFEPPPYEKQERVIKELRAKVPMVGPVAAKLAFIGASPNQMDTARKEPLIGQVGNVFNEVYLKPLGLKRSQVLLGNVVPETVFSATGKEREPNDEEIATWTEWFNPQLQEKVPQKIIALGRVAEKVLGERAAFTLPHPSAVLKYGDSGEVGRKLKRIKTQLVEKQEDSEEGGTRSTRAADFWKKHWHEVFPKSGKGKFVYQHHWRGLDEVETKLDEAALLKTDHSLHGDLRLQGDEGLWGFTVFLGETKDNQTANEDKLIDWKKGDSIEVSPKLQQPEQWLSVGERVPYISEPGQVGATSEKYSKFFKVDGGTYQLGVAREHGIEIFLDGGKLSGRYLFLYAPIAGRRLWLIDKPEDQTPTAESRDLADVLSEQKRKNQQFLIWSKPGESPQKINVRTGRVEKGFVRIAKADTTKQIVYGIVLDPYGDSGPVPDAHNDWSPPAEIEKTAHDFLANSRTINLQHQGKANATVVESWVESYPSANEYKKAMRGESHRVIRRDFGTDKLHSGAWVLGVKLGDKEWKLFQDKKINAFSPGGMGVRTPIQRRDMPNIQFVDLVEKQ